METLENLAQNAVDATVGNASTTKHGLMPKLPNTGSYYRGTGAWTTGGIFVPRLTNAWDWTKASGLTADSALHVDGLDCSSIVPAGAVAIAFKLYLNDDVISSQLFLRHSATYGIDAGRVKTYAANEDNYEFVIIACDTNRLLDYYINANPTAFGIAVLGWFI